MKRPVVGLALVLAACDAPSSDSTGDRLATERHERCGALAAHLVELRLAEVAVDREAHRRALTSALGDRFVASCAEQFDDPAIACAMAAPDHDTAGQCLGGE